MMGVEEVANCASLYQPDWWRSRRSTSDDGIAHCRDAEETTLSVKRGGAGKSRHRHRLAQFDRIAIHQPRFDLGQLAAAFMLFWIGNADKRDIFGV